jgi:hypothetical protein
VLKKKKKKKKVMPHPFIFKLVQVYFFRHGQKRKFLFSPLCARHYPTTYGKTGLILSDASKHHTQKFTKLNKLIQLFLLHRFNSLSVTYSPSLIHLQQLGCLIYPTTVYFTRMCAQARLLGLVSRAARDANGYTNESSGFVSLGKSGLHPENCIISC